MTTPLEATRSIVEAAATVPGLAAGTAGRTGAIPMPVVMVGAPEFEWSDFCTEPSGLVFPVTLLVRLEAGCVERLLGFLADLQAALERDTPASVRAAFPLSYDLGNQVEAAAYELTVQYPL